MPVKWTLYFRVFSPCKDRMEKNEQSGWLSHQKRESISSSFPGSFFHFSFTIFCCCRHWYPKGILSMPKPPKGPLIRFNKVTITLERDKRAATADLFNQLEEICWMVLQYGWEHFMVVNVYTLRVLWCHLHQIKLLPNRYFYYVPRTLVHHTWKR